MLLLTLFLVGTTASTYDLIGYGWCRSQAGQDEKVNGYYRFKLENDACRSQCDFDPNCFGYASESISGSPGYCYIHVPESTPIPAMWLAFTKSNYDIAASSGDTEVKCFIKSGVDFGCGLGNPADAGCGCGQPGPSGCDNQCGSTLEDEGCGCGQPGPSGCDNQCGSTLEDEGCGCGIICEDDYRAITISSGGADIELTIVVVGDENRHLDVNSGKFPGSWEKLSEGSRQFSDRQYVLTHVPDYLLGAQYFRGPCRIYGGASLTIKTSGTVYVLASHGNTNDEIGKLTFDPAPQSRKSMQMDTNSFKVRGFEQWTWATRTTTSPTSLPTTMPTSSPTEMPSKMPSETPSEMPSKEPSMSPTEEPSMTPTYEPSMLPTEKPTPGLCSEDIRSELDSLSCSDGSESLMMKEKLKSGELNKNCFCVNQIDGATFMKDTAYDCKYNAFDTYTIASIFSNCAEAENSCSYWNCGCKESQNENVEFIYGSENGYYEGCQNSFENGGSRCYMKSFNTCVEFPTTCAEADDRICSDIEEGCFWSRRNGCKKIPETCAEAEDSEGCDEITNEECYFSESCSKKPETCTEAQDRFGCGRFFSDICEWNRDTNSCDIIPLTCAEGNKYTCKSITNEECYKYGRGDMFSCRKKPETCPEAQDLYGCRKFFSDICTWNDDTNSCDILPLTCAEGNEYTCNKITNEECYKYNKDDMFSCRKKPETCSEARDRVGCGDKYRFSDICVWNRDTNTCYDKPLTCAEGNEYTCGRITNEECYKYDKDDMFFCRKTPEKCSEARDEKGCGILRDVCKWNHDTENCDLIPLTCAEGNQSTCSKITNEVCMWNSENSSCLGVAEASAHYYVEWEKYGTCQQYSYAALSVCEKIISQALSLGDAFPLIAGTCPNSYVINHQKSHQHGDCNFIFTDFSMAETTHEPTEPSVGSVYATAQAVLDSQVLDFAIKGLAAIGVLSTLIWAYRHCFAGKHTYKELETAVEEI